MPRTNLGGEDPGHQLSDEDKDKLESKMRQEAIELLKSGNSKKRSEILNRAKNISRKPSRKSQHH